MMYFLLLISASPMLAVRTSLEVWTNTSNPRMAGVEAFLKWSTKNCEDCGKTVGSLATGIDSAQFLESSHWHDHTLTVTLTKKHLYGQVAMKSRLPVMWKLNKQVKFTFGENRGGERKIQVEGMGMTPREQGLELYETGLSYMNLNGADCVDDDCILKEEAAVGKYLKENYDKKDKLEKQKGCLIDVLKSSYGSWVTYRTVNTLGKQRWGEIFYATLALSPFTFTSFIIKNGKMGATYKDVDDARYTKYHIPQKMAVTFGNILRHSTVEKGFANKFARSANNFARMLVYAQSNDMEECGQVDAIANLFTWCEGTPPNKLPQCSGKVKGRIGWTTSPHK